MSDAKAVIKRAKRSGVTIKLKNGKPYAEYVGSSEDHRSTLSEVRTHKTEIIRELEADQSIHQLRSEMIWLVDAWNSSAMFNRPKHYMTGDFWMTMFEWDQQATELRSKYNYDKCPLGECDTDRQPVWCKNCSPMAAQQLSLN